MSIEDIDYLKKHSVKETFLFIVDSKDRDSLRYPDPNYYSIKLNTPFKNVIGIDIIDYSIPRTMYSLDIYNNNAGTSDDIAFRKEELKVNKYSTNNPYYNVK
jgi:hypothetical protein